MTSHEPKRFADYAAERAQQASPEESAWVAAFEDAARTCACGRTPDPRICQPEDCALRREMGSHCSCIHPPFGDVARVIPPAK